ncbi:hypothetical protein BTR22_16300 [Alkalihalophilus pseudofirmus]|nr:hypothetical protein BTR22_16300 [Alkalihalophilus pseudofirmus]
MTMRSAFCFVWPSEATDYLNPAARHGKTEASGLACGNIRGSDMKTYLSSFDAPLFPASQRAEARHLERRKGSFRYEEDGALTMRSAFCFVWPSEATDYLNPAARHGKTEASV